jgi:hypothetical protein
MSQKSEMLDRFLVFGRRRVVVAPGSFFPPVSAQESGPGRDRFC